MSARQAQAEARSLAADDTSGILRRSNTTQALTTSDFCKWKMGVEANLAGLKERLKAKNQLVEQLRSNSDNLRISNEKTKAETETLQRDTGRREEILASIRKDLERIHFQQGQIVKTTTSLTAFKENLEGFNQKQLWSHDALARRLAQLSMEQRVKTKAWEDALKKTEDDFETDFMKVFEAERKIQIDEIKNLELSLKKRDEEKVEKSSGLNSLSSDKVLLIQKLESAETLIEGLEERTISLNEEEIKTEALMKELRNLEELESSEVIGMKSAEENYGLILNELEKVTYEVECIKDEGSDILKALSILTTSNEETLSEEKKLQLESSNLSKLKDSLNQELEIMRGWQAETESLTKQHQDIQADKLLAQERFDDLSKKETIKLNLDKDTMELSQGAHDLEDEVEVSKSRVAEIKEKLKENENVVNEMEMNLKSLTEEKEEKTKQIDSLKQKLDFEEASRLQQDKENTEKDIKMSTTKQDVENLHQKIGNIEKNLMIWSSELETSGAELQREEEAGKKVSDSNDVLRVELEDMKKEKEKTELGAESQVQSFQQKKSEVKRLEKELREASSRQKKCAMDVNLRKEELVKKEKSQHHRISEASDLDVKINSVTSDIEVLNREMIEGQEKLEKLDEAKAEQKEMKKVVASLNSDIKKRKKELVSSRRSLTTAIKSRDKLRKQLGKNSTATASTKSQVDKLAESLENLKEEIKRLGDKKIVLKEELDAPEAVGEINKEELEKRIKVLEETKQKKLEDLESSSKELQGILVSRENEFLSGFGALKKDLEDKESILNAKKEQLMEVQDGKEESSTEMMKTSNQQLLQEVIQSRADLQTLQEELRTAETLSCSEAGGSSDPTPGTARPMKRKFFKTPRSPSVYVSPLSPSPKKKLSTKKAVNSRTGRTISKSAPPSPTLVPRSYRDMPKQSPAKAHSKSGKKNVDQFEFDLLMELSDCSQ